MSAGWRNVFHGSFIVDTSTGSPSAVLVCAQSSSSWGRCCVWAPFRSQLGRLGNVLYTSTVGLIDARRARPAILFLFSLLLGGRLRAHDAKVERDYNTSRLLQLPGRCKLWPSSSAGVAFLSRGECNICGVTGESSSKKILHSIERSVGL